MSAPHRARWRRSAAAAGARSRGRSRAIDGPPRSGSRPASLARDRDDLELSLRHYAQLFDFAPVGYVAMNTSGIIVDLNLPAAAMLGYERVLLKGVPLLRLVTARDHSAFARHLLDARNRHQPVSMTELHFRRKDGFSIFLQLTSRGTVDSSTDACIYSVLTDVTEQRAAESARQRLAAIVEFSDDAIIGKDLDGFITSWNGGAQQLFGYVPRETMGRPMTMLIPEDRLDEENRILQKIRRGESVSHYDTIRRRQDGSEVHVSLTVSPVRDGRGRVVGASHIARDITPRKQAEEALLRARDELEQRVQERTKELRRANVALRGEVLAHQRAEDALRQGEARLQAIMENSPAMILLKDAKGRYLMYNRRFQEAFCLAPGSLIGKTDGEIFPAAQAASLLANDRRVIEDGKPIQFEQIMTREDGLHTSIVSKFPIHDAAGNLYAIGGVITDITERKRLEGEVLRISEHERKRIAVDLHDGLGQQLTGTWFLCDTLRKNLAANGSHDLPAAIKIVELLESAVSQTRSLSRGLSPVAPQPNGLMAALEELAKQVSELFRVKCRLVCPGVMLDDNNKSTHLYRIAQEALNNSIKHGRAKSIEIELSARNGHVTLQVEDDGVGFKKPPNKHQGMGLRTMKYRADLIGAEFAIVNTRGPWRTKVVCTVPN